MELCENCGQSDDIFALGLCAACYQYQRRHGEDRPERLYKSTGRTNIRPGDPIMGMDCMLEGKVLTIWPIPDDSAQCQIYLTDDQAALIAGIAAGNPPVIRRIRMPDS